MALVSTTSSPGLVSVGYEGRTLQDLLEVLAAEGVAIVADVRLTPLSRKPGLSKTKLAAALAEAGIEYVHLRALGNPKDNRAPFWSGSPAVGVRRFRHMLADPERSASIDELAAIASKHRVAVLCFERDHDRCHRQVVVDATTARQGDSSAPVAYA
jgi:uncharacterized protein (DUF488 family)